MNNKVTGQKACFVDPNCLIEFNKKLNVHVRVSRGSCCGRAKCTGYDNATKDSFASSPARDCVMWTVLEDHISWPSQIPFPLGMHMGPSLYTGFFFCPYLSHGYRRITVRLVPHAVHLRCPVHPIFDIDEARQVGRFQPFSLISQGQTLLTGRAWLLTTPCV